MKNALLSKIAVYVGMFSLIFGLQACDTFGVKSTGDLMTLEFDETDFEGLDLCLPGKAEVRVGDEFKVEITCEESAMPYVETKVEDDILKVYFSRNVYDVDHMKIVVTAPSWKRFEVSGSGDIVIEDLIEGQFLKMDVSGSGSIRGEEAHYENVDLRVAGSGDLKLAGTVESLDCDISGSGTIKCFDLIAEKAKVEVSGSGDVQVNVSDVLDAEISGSGTIVYKGDPQVNAHVSGSGSIKKY